jgi:predicted nucleotidyltransferase
MPSPIDLRPEDLVLVRSLLRTHVPTREVRAFGSRVSGGAKKTSDLDLCVMGKVPIPQTAAEGLRMAFSESSLPIRVDLVQWAELRSGFRKIVESSSVVVYPEMPGTAL